jgi:hypothetical protein
MTSENGRSRMAAVLQGNLSMVHREMSQLLGAFGLHSVTATSHLARVFYNYEHLNCSIFFFSPVVNIEHRGMTILYNFCPFNKRNFICPQGTPSTS